MARRKVFDFSLKGKALSATNLAVLVHQTGRRNHSWFFTSHEIFVQLKDLESFQSGADEY